MPEPEGSLLSMPVDPEPVADPAPVADPVADPEPAADPAPVAEPEVEPEPEGAPESYEDFVAPEGVELDKGLIEAFGPVAKDLGLTQEKAQKLVDMYAAQQKAQGEAARQKETEQLQVWRDSFTQDPKHKQTLIDANKALSKLASPEEAEFFKTTWLGDNPTFIGFVAKVGKALGEAPVLEGKQGTQALSLAEIMYPNHNK